MEMERPTLLTLVSWHITGLVSMLKTLTFLLLLFVFVPFRVDSAEFRLESDLLNIGVGDEFLVTILIDTQGENINALEGEILFPQGILGLERIWEKGSLVNLWIQEPNSEEGKEGRLSFSGLTPGGYEGEGVVFSVVLRAKTEGAGTITMSKERTLLNDGSGTPASLAVSPLEFFISPQTSTPPRTLAAKTEDTEAPEPFELRIATDENLFNGQPFLVFAAQDKSSGISHYEISFTRSGEKTSWERAASPFLLEQYDEIEEIRVKAVDRAGKERIASLSLQNSFAEFLSFRNIVILMGIGGTLIYLFWRRKRTP